MAFIIFSLPRSRSAWLAHWLAGSGLAIGHDLGIECDSPQALLDSYSFGMSGTVETGGAVEGWRLLRRAIPGLRMATVRRPLLDVEDSLARFGIEAHEELLIREAMLDEVELIGGAESLKFEDLKSIHVRHWLWRYCLGETPFVAAWDAACEVTNIQVDMPTRLARLRARQSQIEACQHQLRGQLARRPCQTLH